MRLTLLSILLAACGNKEPAPAVKTAPAPVAVDAGSAPIPPEPPKPSDSGPLSAEAPVWPDATSTTGPITFKRDFKKPGSWLYGYRQNMTLTSNLGGKIDVTAMQAKGTLTVESNRDGTATGRVSGNITAHDVGDPQPMSTQMTFEIPIREKGMADTKDDPTAAMVALLLPFPSKPMKIGDTDSMRFTLPVTGNPAMTSVEGPLTLTLVGHSKIGNRTCARFETALAIDKKRGGSHVKMTLAGKVCIDPVDGAVVASFLAIDMKATTTGADPIDMSFAGVLGLDRI